MNCPHGVYKPIYGGSPSCTKSTSEYPITHKNVYSINRMGFCVSWNDAYLKK